MKTCNRCDIDKPISEYYKNTRCKDGHKAICKECCRIAFKEYYQKNKEKYHNKNKKWQANNPDKVRAYGKKIYEKHKQDPEFVEANRLKSEKWRSENKERARVANKKWYEENSERVVEYNREWRKNNPDKMRAYTSKQMEKPDYKLNHSMRGNMSRSIRGEKGRRSWESLAGYTIYDLRGHLEALFTEGMSWDNYGSWEIDHIIPISVFNFTTAECIDFKRCWSLENLQPLWAKENRAKWTKLEDPFQPSLELQA